MTIGLGAMIATLGGVSEDSARAVQGALGKTIATFKLDAAGNDGDGKIVLTFADGTTLMFYDNARSCCESRFITTDDNLPAFEGAVFQGAEVREGPTVDAGSYGDVSEVEFLDLKTSNGVVQFVTHNEHNGYYGGICLVAR